MIVIAVAAVLVLVLVAALWSRIAASRLERRSVEGYGRALDTLGGVARRSEAGAPVQAPTGPELARPHVRPSSDAEPHARPAPAPVAPAPRIRLRPPSAPGRMPVFSDLPLEGGDEPAAAMPDLPASVNGGHARPAPEEEPTLAFPRPANDGAPPWADQGDGARSGDDDPLTGDDDPLTMVLPVVPAEAAPGPEAAPMGPYLPGDEPPAAPPVAPALHRPSLLFDGVGAAGGEADEGGAPGPGEAERSQRVRRAATGAAAAVAIGALGAGGWQLAADSGGHTHPAASRVSVPASSVPVAPPAGSGKAPAGSGAASPGTGRSGTAGRGGAAPSTTVAPSTTTTAPSGRAGSSALQPTSTTSSLVVYQAPASHYTITFSVTGSSDCWLGAQASPGGKYLWMQTVPAGGTASYTASGPVVIRLGAPPVVSVEVNGVKVALPPGNVQPYDISFTSSGTAA